MAVQNDFLKLLAVSTTQRYSVHCQRGIKKPENTGIKTVGASVDNKSIN